MNGLTISTLPVGVLIRKEGPFDVRTTVEIMAKSQTTYLVFKQTVKNIPGQEDITHSVTIKEDQYEDFAELVSQAFGLAANFVENGPNK